MAQDFKHASLVEGVRFTAQVGIPNVVQGLFKKREAVVGAVAKVPAEKLAYDLLAKLAKKYGPDPFWVRVGKEETLLLTHPEDIEKVLGGSPSPFAPDPEAKKKGMTAFQPTALSISRGDLWTNRRAFADAVLQPGATHALAKRFAALAVEAADELVAAGNPLTYDVVNETFQRLTRRVVFGDAAADDTALTAQLQDLLAAGNSMPGAPAEGYEEFHSRIAAYVGSPDPDALTGMIPSAPSTDATDVPGQLIHWLFAMGDTLPANLYRALGALATHPTALGRVRAEIGTKKLTTVSTVTESTYLAGCILEAMRLWPTTGLFGRVQDSEVRWKNGEKTPVGTPLLIHNLFNHRNRDRIAYADRYAPEEWSEGAASQDWSFNFFSHGPQGCPGAGLSIFLGQAFLGRLVTSATPTLQSGPKLSWATPLPYTFDIYATTIALGAL